jgi:hypothetical protein
MNYAMILSALISVESGGNDRAIGDGGEARGALQIHREVVADVNRISGKRFDWVRMTNRAEARQVAEIYLRHYATPQRLGRAVTPQDVARIWNGGPMGYKSKATLPYLKKFNSRIK